MTQPATILSFPNHLIDAPRCAQCKTKMNLQRVEPAHFGRREARTYACPTCGLADRIETVQQNGADIEGAAVRRPF